MNPLKCFLHLKILKSASKYLKIPAKVMKIVIFHNGWLKKQRFQMGHVGKQCANVPKLG
jgi:tartrate dehydratase beta subunit/fumarate hydratase class I family protein